MAGLPDPVSYNHIDYGHDGNMGVETTEGVLAMERKRSHLEISRDILEVAKTGARPTALVYKANLNFNIIKKYLRELEDSGLIRVDAVDGGGSGTRIYTTTPRGLIFMESLGRTMDIYRGAPPELAPVS